MLKGTWMARTWEDSASISSGPSALASSTLASLIGQRLRRKELKKSASTVARSDISVDLAGRSLNATSVEIMVILQESAEPGQLKEADLLGGIESWKVRREKAQAVRDLTRWREAICVKECWMGLWLRLREKMYR